MTILVTGGLGFIGSHTVVDLIEKGEDCLIVDNLSKTTIDVLYRIESIVKKPIPFIEMDLLDKEALHSIFSIYNITAVIHFAGYKSVGESVENPLIYYQNNLISTLNLLDVMKEYNVKKLVFSSSATVYGDCHNPPLKEDMSLGAPNPYGRTKLMLEDILRDLAASDKTWHITLLRYFNPIGAHNSGLLGEIPYGMPNNLMPHVLKAASGETAKLQVFGGDYDTADGTCIRDFIHIMDLANGHVKALEYVEHNAGCEAFNLGTGSGYSVLELIHTFEEVNQLKVPYEIVNRRDGDIVVSYADASKVKSILGWTTTKDLSDMCIDSWNWSRKIKEFKVSEVKN